MAQQRVSSGVPGLDELIEGGFPANRAILVCGQAGTGKTTLSTQFLMDGISRGEPGVLVSVDQKPQHLVEDAGRFRWDLKGATEQRLLALLDASPYFTAARGRRQELDARQVASDLTQQARRVGARRLVIDSLTSLLPEDGVPAQVHDFLRSLFFSLEDNLGCTVLLTAWNAGAGPSRAAQVAESLASGVLELKLVPTGGRFGRTLLVRKMRGTSTDLSEQAFEIVDERGVVLQGRS